VTYTANTRCTNLVADVQCTTVNGEDRGGVISGPNCDGNRSQFFAGRITNQQDLFKKRGRRRSREVAGNRFGNKIESIQITLGTGG